jgi:tetratricopeptide (TPR) repeat protein
MKKIFFLLFIVQLFVQCNKNIDVDTKNDSSSGVTIIDDSSSEFITYYNKKNGKIESFNLLLAVEDCKDIKLKSDSFWLYYKRGDLKYKLKDFQGAIEDYTKAIKINPNFPEAYYKRGFTKYALKNYHGAIEDYTKSIEIKPNFAMAYFGRGNAKLELKQDLEPCADWKKAIELGLTDETNISPVIANCNISDL